MKKILIVLLTLIFGIVIWYGESRKFISFPKSKYVTVWKTYNNKCYIILGKYHGLFKPSSGQTYIKTTNTSMGVGLIWETGSDTILAQVDSGSIIYNNPLTKIQIKDYNINMTHNDSIYTYYDTTLHINLYKKNINLLSISINEMGAL